MKTLEEKMTILERESNFVKGVIHGQKMLESMRAFNVMKALHNGVQRKGGLAYSTHPVRVAHQLLANGVTDDNVIAAALLHDVLEDCNVTESALQEQFDISEKVLSIVASVTKKKGYNSVDYYSNINNTAEAMLVKISDRLHNLSTMHGAFSKEKMLEYVKETYEFVIPMCKNLKYRFPQYANVSYIMKNQIETICEIYESLLTK